MKSVCPVDDRPACCIALEAGPGRVLVQAACAVCHSVDCIVMNSPFQDRNGWTKTVSP